MVQIYSIAVHNSKVRRAVQGGVHYDGMSDRWAYTNFFDIEAPSRHQALETIMERLPPHQGYVVDSIELRHNFGWNKFEA